MRHLKQHEYQKSTATQHQTTKCAFVHIYEKKRKTIKKL
jgi:hypothetical protein